MSYSHLIERSGPLLGIVHSRESAHGRIVGVETIARTQAIFATIVAVPETSSIVVPTAEEILNINNSRTDSGAVSVEVLDEIVCADLDEFVSLGIERWRQLIANVHGIVRVRLDMGEHRDAETETRFRGFAPDADEIIALDRIANAANELLGRPTGDVVGLGHYL